MLKAASFTPRTAFPKAANIFNKPRTGCSVTNPWNGADFVTQNSGKVLFGICLQLNNYIVGPNYLSYNPSRNGMQPLKHFWYPSRFHIDQDIRIHRYWGPLLMYLLGRVFAFLVSAVS